jgi:hypothetical protein
MQGAATMGGLRTPRATRRAQLRTWASPHAAAGLTGSVMPRAKPNQSRKKLAAAKAIANPKRIDRPRRILEPVSEKARPRPKCDRDHGGTLGDGAGDGVGHRQQRDFLRHART